MGRSSRLILLLGIVWLAAAPAVAAIPPPSAHFGFRMGADRKLVEWDDLVRYFRILDRESSSIRVTELGKSTEGRPFLMATIANPATLASLERYRDIQARLADPRLTTPRQAEALMAQGKTVVLITCSIHSTEVASTHTAIEFVYRLLSEDTPRHRAILDNTIFLLIPSLNPDGVDKVAQWYKRYLGTPYEGASMVELYHKYTGHDNNRDWYMFTQAETRLTVEKAHNAWHPQIVYDVHQMGQNGARMFVPPWLDPMDPNIDALIAQQGNLFGMAMASDLTAAGKKGVAVNAIYDYFTPARHYQSYHGGMRLLSESASVRYATPVRIPFSSLQTRGRGFNAQEASWNFLEPWPGGEWKLRDIVDYQSIAFESVLYNAALRRDELLRNFYRIGQRVMERNAALSYVVPRQQHDPAAMARLLGVLEFGEVEIERARAEFTAAGQTYHEGDYVIRLGQPYGAFAKTLLERQDYPDLREYPGGPPRRPYDVTAHSLPLLMGVEARLIEQPLRANLAPAAGIGPPPGRVAPSPVVAFSAASSGAWIALNRLLEAGVAVFRDRRNGDFYLRNDSSAAGPMTQLAAEFGVEFHATNENPSLHRRLRRPRIGLYQGHVPIMDEGWTRWLLEHYEFPYQTVGNARLQGGDLADDFDVIILPDASPRNLHAGYFPGALYNGVEIPPEFTGGIQDDGAEALKEFVRSGGAILAFNAASGYAIERLGAPARDVLKGAGEAEFYAPGTLLNVNVDLSHPLCHGMRPREAVWFESGPAFAVRTEEDRTVAPVLLYPRRGVLASGWLLGEERIADRAAVVDVSIGRGHMVLFGIRPQYRAQSNATFKMLFNGLFYW